MRRSFDTRSRTRVDLGINNATTVHRTRSGQRYISSGPIGQMEPVCQVRLTKMHPSRRCVHVLPTAIGAINAAFRGKGRGRPDGASPNTSQKRIQWEVTLRLRALVGGSIGRHMGKDRPPLFRCRLPRAFRGAFAEMRPEARTCAVCNK